MANSLVDRPPVVFLMGPTAAGKTAAAMALTDQLASQDPVQLISVDSALVYREMDIGTAKPSREELTHYPHALIDILDPTQSYSVAQFIKDATRSIDQAHDAGQLPILVGGTMLYFKGLLQGLSETPTANQTVRQHIQSELANHGSDYAHQWLTSIDLQSAQRLHPSDRQRIERALEIYLSTGEKMSAQYDQRYFAKGWDQHCLQQHRWNILPIALAPESKQQLHPLIETRFKAMVNSGFLDEVQALMTKEAIHSDLPSMRCVGYRQAWSYLQGEINKPEFFEQGCAATRQLAKRQMTWLRNWTSPTWIDSLKPDCNTRLLQTVQTFLG